jgi:hypothetical protein
MGEFHGLLESQTKSQEIGMDRRVQREVPLMVNYPKCSAHPLGLAWMTKRWTPFY